MRSLLLVDEMSTAPVLAPVPRAIQTFHFYERKYTVDANKQPSRLCACKRLFERSIVSRAPTQWCADVPRRRHDSDSDSRGAVPAERWAQTVAQIAVSRKR
jgi:hypothetical protein